MNDENYTQTIKFICWLCLIWYISKCFHLFYKSLSQLMESPITIWKELLPYVILFSSVPMFIGTCYGYFIYSNYSKLGIIITITSIIGIIIWQIYLFPFIL